MRARVQAGDGPGRDIGGSTSVSSSLGIFPPWGSEHPFPPRMPSASTGLVKLAKRWTGERVERCPKGHPCLPHCLALVTGLCPAV